MLKVLVVDDEDNVCELVRLYLSKEGYEVLKRPMMGLPVWKW